MDEREPAAAPDDPFRATFGPPRPAITTILPAPQPEEKPKRAPRLPAATTPIPEE